MSVFFFRAVARAQRHSCSVHPYDLMIDTTSSISSLHPPSPPRSLVPLYAQCGGNGTETAAADKGKTAVTGGVGGNGSRCPSCGVSDATASSMWRHLAEVTSILMAGKDPEVAATLIHLMLGPNTFYMSLKVQGAQPDPEPDEDFWALFDLNEETALDYAEEMNYKDIANHWESFDTYLCLFTAFLSQMLPTLSHELGSKTLGNAVCMFSRASSLYRTLVKRRSSVCVCMNSTKKKP